MNVEEEENEKEKRRKESNIEGKLGERVNQGEKVKRKREEKSEC